MAPTQYLFKAVNNLTAKTGGDYMRNLSIGKKLLVTFLIVLLLYVLSLGIAIFSGMQSVSSSFTGFYTGPHQIVKAAMDLRRGLEAIEKNITHIILETKEDNVAQYEAEMNNAIYEVNVNIEFLRQHLTSEGDRQRVEQIYEKNEQANEIRHNLFQYVTQKRKNLALQVYNEQYAPMAQEIQSLAIGISQAVEEVGNNYYNSAKAAASNTTRFVVVFFVVSIVIVLLLSNRLIRSIVRPVREVETVAKQLADGKLDVEVRYTSKDEMGALAESIRILIQHLRGYITDISHILGQMAKGDMTVSVDRDYPGDFLPIRQSMEEILSSLNHMLVQIDTSSQQIATGSQQMAAGAQALSHGSAEQAASVEELASTLSEILQKVKQNTENAQQASINVKDTEQELVHGNEQMKALMGAMDEIAKQSNKIQQIIKTIDDIAFQTNILSLNAAVEAARAGSAGKGFAVVAEEVRNLANRSAQAAKDTGELIQNTLAAIQNGENMAKATEKAMEAVMKKAKTVSQLVQNIAAASKAQANSIEEINQGVNQISGIIQTNSATAEESAASSEELSAQASMLKSLVSQFKLKKSGGTSTKSSGSPAKESPKPAVSHFALKKSWIDDSLLLDPPVQKAADEPLVTVS